MVLSAEQQRVKMLIRDTIALMCKNGLAFNNEFSIDAVIGVTLDNQSLFYMSFNEVIKADKESDNLLEEVVNSESDVKVLPRKRHKAEPNPSEKDDTEDNSHHSEMSKSSQQDMDQDSSLKLEPVNANNEKPVSIKQEIGDNWDSLATEIAGSTVTSAGTSDNMDSSFISHSLYLGGLDAYSVQNNTWPLGNMSKPAGSLTETGENSQTTQWDRHKSSNFSKNLFFSELTTHTSVSDKETASRYCYRCNWCGKQFSCPDNLRGHMTIHTGIKQFQCMHCGKQYQYNCTLQRHVKSCKRRDVADTVDKRQQESCTHNTPQETCLHDTPQETCLHNTPQETCPHDTPQETCPHNTP